MSFDSSKPEFGEPTKSQPDGNESDDVEVVAALRVPNNMPKSNVADLPEVTTVDHLSRLHPMSLVFDLLAHGKTYLVPALFGLWGAAKGDLTLLIISALIFVPAFMVSVFRYFTFRYSIQGDKLVVTSGLVFRNVRTVPVARIQNIDFVQNPLHRILNVAEVKIETASGTKPEATLRVLSMHKMEELRTSVFDRQSKSPVKSMIATEGAGTSNSSELADSELDSPYLDSSDRASLEATTLLEIPTSWLVKAGLASNRGLIMVGVLIGAYFQFDRRTNFDVGWFQSLMPENTPTTVIVAAAVGGLIGALILLRVLGIGWFVLRFYGYKLIALGDDLRISCGLLTKVSATVPRHRIQFISIHRNLIMRILGMASIRIETAGGAGQGNENATESVSKRWFVPAIPEQQVSGLISALRPELEWDESNLNFRSLSTKVGRRLSRLAIIEAVVICGIGLAITRPWGWLGGVALLPLLLMWAVKKSKAMRYARTENGVVYRSGVLNRKTSVTFFEKIQTLRVDQSPIDRRWKMASLSVDTAAAGPAQHQIKVPYLDETFARQELQLLRLKTGQEQPVFG